MGTSSVTDAEKCVLICDAHYSLLSPEVAVDDHRSTIAESGVFVPVRLALQKQSPGREISNVGKLVMVKHLSCMIHPGYLRIVQT